MACLTLLLCTFHVRTPYVVLAPPGLTQAQRIRSRSGPTRPILGVGRTTSRNTHRSLPTGTHLPPQIHPFLCEVHRPHQAKDHTAPLRRSITMRHMNHMKIPVPFLYRNSLARAVGRLYHKEWMRRTRCFTIHVPITQTFVTRAAPGTERHFACAFVSDYAHFINR
jgi:hypothetical protein